MKTDYSDEGIEKIAARAIARALWPKGGCNDKYMELILGCATTAAVSTGAIVRSILLPELEKAKALIELNRKHIDDQDELIYSQVKEIEGLKSELASLRKQDGEVRVGLFVCTECGEKILPMGNVRKKDEGRAEVKATLPRIVTERNGPEWMAFFEPHIQGYVASAKTRMGAYNELIKSAKLTWKLNSPNLPASPKDNT